MAGRKSRSNLSRLNKAKRKAKKRKRPGHWGVSYRLRFSKARAEEKLGRAPAGGVHINYTTARTGAPLTTPSRGAGAFSGRAQLGGRR